MTTRILWLLGLLSVMTACNKQPSVRKSERTEQFAETPVTNIPQAEPSPPPQPPAPRVSAPPAPRGGVEGEPWPTPGGAPERLAIGDLDGDGRPEVLLLSHTGLLITDARGKELARAPAFGHPNQVTLGPSQGPDRGTFWVGWGYGRHHLKGPARVLRYRYQGGRLQSEPVLTHESERPNVTGVALGSWKGKPGALISVFSDKYFTDFLFASPKGATWQTEPLAKVRMGNAIAMAPVRDPKREDLIVARVYGDHRGAKGDAFVLDPSGERVPISIQGGARAVTAVDLDGDGRLEILLGDGWAQAYAREGRALITKASYRDGAFHSEVIGELPGEFMVQKLLAGDLTGDKRPEILALGNASLTLLRRAGAGPFTLTRLTGGDPQDFAVGDLNGDGKPDILVAYPHGVRLLKVP